MSITPRPYTAPSSAGTIAWFPDSDFYTPIPNAFPGWQRLSTTSTTLISGALTRFPSLYARFTSTSSSSPVYRTSEHIIVQKMQGFPKRTKSIQMSFTSISFSPYLNDFRFYNDGNSAGWRMNFHLAGTQGGGANPNCTLANITLLGGICAAVTCCCSLSGAYTTATNATIDQYSGCRLFSNNGSGSDFVAFWGEVPIYEPTSYLSASVYETPPLTPFIRLYDGVFTA